MNFYQNDFSLDFFRILNINAFSFDLDKMNKFIKDYTVIQKKLLSKIFAEYNVSNLRIPRNFPSINANQIISIGFSTGIQNFGNTCYINSVIQCLNGSPAFVEFIYSITEKYNALVFCDEFELLTMYAQYVCNTIVRESNRDTDCFNHELINMILKIISPHFNTPESEAINTGQQDAHEFLIHFFKYLSESFDQIIFIYLSDSRRPTPDIDQFEKMNSINLVTIRKCMSCRAKYENTEKQTCLTVEISSESVSIADCLDNFFDVETMSDPLNLPNCSKCRKKAPAIRQVSISSCNLPKLLVIQLIRFGVIINCLNLMVYSNFLK